MMPLKQLFGSKKAALFALFLLIINVQDMYGRTVDTHCTVNCESFPALCENGGTCRVRYNCTTGLCVCDGLVCDCPENYTGACCEKEKIVI